MTLAPGSQIAQYRVDRWLGGGGMGDVYLARDTRLDRPVAIKFLREPADDQARHRLMREARAVAALDHPGICAVYEVGSDPAGGDFIAMQYIEGETLATRLRRGRMRPDDVMSLAAHVADALMAAHKRGIIHRDLKPQNIIITPSGLPKLLDFGLATYAPNTPASANAITQSIVDESEAVVGTPAYMAPEQIRNEPADFRSDVFSLGTVLYECLTGRRAFPGASKPETLAAVLHVDPPSVSTTVTELGPMYDVLCARMLHKRPEERFQSAEEVLGAIRGLTPSGRFPAVSVSVHKKGSVTFSRGVVLSIASAAAISVATYAFWPFRSTLPVAPSAAAQWYETGVEAMRDGTYAAARSAFSEAIKLFPRYAQAYSRQAEANIALDDERGAGDALLAAAKLVPDRSRLSDEDRLRFDAASASALRQRDAAAKAYQELADLQPTDAGRWLDVGRAEETAGRLPNATLAFAKAVGLDGQSAAARLRLGILQVRTGKTTEGLASIDEAIRLYRAATKTEGEAEALLRKGVALATLGQTDAARKMFEQVIQLAANSRFPAQRLGAQMGLAKLAYVSGHARDAEEIAGKAVEDAKAAGLPTLAAAGLIDLGFYLVGMGLYERADVQLTEAIQLASERNAKRVEMRAKLTQASLRVQSEQPSQALTLAAEPAKYFKEAGEARNTADANLIMSRAHSALDQFDEANTLARDVLAFAESANDEVRKGNALENLAGSLTYAGRLPEALAERERIDVVHRAQKDQSSLPKDLTNHAELLILLGRGRDADELLREVDTGIAAGVPSYVGRRTRVLVLRALLLSTQLRLAEANHAISEALTTIPKPAPGVTLNSTQMFAIVLAEYVRAQLGQSKQTTALIASWPGEAATPSDRREWSYWVARTLLSRGDSARAVQICAAILADPIVQADPELGWRLAAVAADAKRRLNASGDIGNLAEQARTSIDQIKKAWAGAAEPYLSRPDLAVLVRTVQ